MIDVKIKLIDEGCLPKLVRDGDVCYDCRASIEEGTEVCIAPHSRTLIPLGFALELPENYEAVIRPRSGLSGKGIDVCIGTIDTNYRGEVSARVCNNSDDYFKIEPHDRICQMAIRETPVSNLVVVKELSETNRGKAGFGSTGVK